MKATTIAQISDPPHLRFSQMPDQFQNNVGSWARHTFLKHIKRTQNKGFKICLEVLLIKTLVTWGACVINSSSRMFRTKCPFSSPWLQCRLARCSILCLGVRILQAKRLSMLVDKNWICSFWASRREQEEDEFAKSVRELTGIIIDWVVHVYCFRVSPILQAFVFCLVIASWLRWTEKNIWFLYVDLPWFTTGNYVRFVSTVALSLCSFWWFHAGSQKLFSDIDTLSEALKIREHGVKQPLHSCRAI